MQKDEGGLLSLFIKYHARFSGFESIFILDNGSQDGETLAVLENAEESGANIIRGFQSSDDFEKKGSRIVEVIQERNLKRAFDFLFPMDCDELLCLEADGAISLSTSEIINHLKSLGDGKQGFRVRKGFNNIPLSCDRFEVYQASKIFFSASSDIETLDTGFHGRGLDHLVPCELGYLHLHNKPYHKVLRSAREKLKARINTFTTEEFSRLRNRKGGKGVHLIKYFMMSEAEFYRKDSTRPVVFAPLSTLAKAAGEESFVSGFTSRLNTQDETTFWLKSPTNHYIVDECVWKSLGTKASNRPIIIGFSDFYRGCPNGNDIFSKGRGYGWLKDLSLSRQSNTESSPPLESSGMEIDSSVFRIELPRGCYRIAMVVENRHFDGYSLTFCVFQQTVATGPIDKGSSSRLECAVDHSGGALDLKISCDNRGTILKLISFELVSSPGNFQSVTLLAPK